jgi:hypothetical protein
VTITQDDPRASNESDEDDEDDDEANPVLLALRDVALAIDGG